MHEQDPSDSNNQVWVLITQCITLLFLQLCIVIGVMRPMWLVKQKFSFWKLKNENNNDNLINKR